MNPPMVCHICQWVHQFLCLLRLLALFPTGGASHPRQGTVLSAFAHYPLAFLSKINLIISCSWLLLPSLLLYFRILVADSLLLSSHLVYDLSSLLSSISQSQWIGFLMMDHISHIAMIVDPYCIWSDLV